MSMLNVAFTRFSRWAARWSGRPAAFMLALAAILVWAITGPLFEFSDTWQLVINTGTTIITFLMVFLIQNTQNRDTEALHLKIDELIRATSGAYNLLINLEEVDDDEMERFRQLYQALAIKAKEDLQEGMSPVDVPDVVMTDVAAQPPSRVITAAGANDVSADVS